MSGHVKLYRKTLQSWLWDLPAGQLKVALTLLLEANWRPTWAFRSGGVIEVGRGEVLTSVRALAKRSRQSVRTARSALANLQSAGFVRVRPAQKTAKAGSVISIVNYDKYHPLAGPTDTDGDTIPTQSRHENRHSSDTDNDTAATQSNACENVALDFAGPDERHAEPSDSDTDSDPIKRSKEERKKSTTSQAAARGVALASEVVSWLNAKLGKQFRPGSKTALEAGRRWARLKYSAEEVIAALELRLGDQRAVNGGKPTRWENPGTLFNGNLSKWVDAHRAGLKPFYVPETGGQAQASAFEAWARVEHELARHRGNGIPEALKGTRIGQAILACGGWLSLAHRTTDQARRAFMQAYKATGAPS